MEIFTLPVYKNGPIGKFYKKIDFKNCYQNWDLVIIDTIGDGSCLFHAICNSFFVPYYTEILNGEKIQRRDLVRQMRKEFSEKLSSPISLEANSKTHYELINSGMTSQFPVINDLPEYNFSLDNMKKQLDSTNNIGYGYIEYICNILNKNIYILSESKKDIYLFEKNELSNIYKKDRPSIVLYYTDSSDIKNDFGHYELVGIMNNGIIDTHFSPDHTFIKFLYNKVSNKS